MSLPGAADSKRQMADVVADDGTRRAGAGLRVRPIRKGAELYAVNCSPCHGLRMQGSESAFDLRKFPPDKRERFLSSVTRGKNQMPPWGDALSPDQLDALWAYIYVTAGER